MNYRPNWALSLAALMLIGAGLACSVAFSTAHFEDAALYGDPEGMTRARSFAPDAPIFVIAILRDAAESAEVRAVWSRVTRDERGRVLEAVPVDTDERASDEARVVFEMTPAAATPAVWPLGDYRVALFIDGERAETLDFKIR